MVLLYATLVIVLLLIIMAFIGIEQGKKQKARLGDVSLICMCKYYGGYEDKMDSMSVSLLNNKEKQEIIISFIDGEKIIPAKDIKNLTTKKEEELKQEVTLGRFLLVGALAIFWRKNKIENRKFVIINYFDQEENKDRNVLFESPVAEIIYTKLKEAVQIQ